MKSIKPGDNLHLRHTDLPYNRRLRAFHGVTLGYLSKYQNCWYRIFWWLKLLRCMLNHVSLTSIGKSVKIGSSHCVEDLMCEDSFLLSLMLMLSVVSWDDVCWLFAAPLWTPTWERGWESRPQPWPNKSSIPLQVAPSLCLFCGR